MTTVPRRPTDSTCPAVRTSAQSTISSWWRTLVRVAVLPLLVVTTIGLTAAPEVHAQGEIDGNEVVDTTSGSSTEGDERPEGTATDDDAEVWMVVGGLVGVAMALTAITVVYWRRTKPRPRRLSFLDDFDDDADVLVPVED